MLGKLIANIAASFDPEAVILFGGLANSGDLLLQPAKESLLANSLDYYKDRIKILVSELGNGKAAILGASSLVMNL